jgi:putative membrane protein
MVVFERIFGVGGIIVAPVYYAYLKNELKQQKLI